jgi:hypothetical protein
LQHDVDEEYYFFQNSLKAKKWQKYLVSGKQFQKKPNDNPDILIINATCRSFSKSRVV